jgi:hypothetical protein
MKEDEDEEFLRQVTEIRMIAKTLLRSPQKVTVHLWAGNDLAFDPACGCKENPLDGQTLNRESVTCPDCLKLAV